MEKEIECSPWKMSTEGGKSVDSTKVIMNKLQAIPIQLSFDFCESEKSKNNVIYFSQYKIRGEITACKDVKKKSIRILLEQSKNLEW
jgi:hypothetical protein